MTYNFLFTMITFIPILFWFASSLLVAMDAERMPAEAWTAARESKNVWVVISLLLMWPFGLFFYLLVVRKQVAAISKSMEEEILISKAADRIRNESATNRTPLDDDLYEEGEYEDDADYEEEAYELDARASESDSVFDYEESPSQHESQVTGVVIPPKPARAPRASSADKTAVHPVIPPKPARAPRTPRAS